MASEIAATQQFLSGVAAAPRLGKSGNVLAVLRNFPLFFRLLGEYFLRSRTNRRRIAATAS
ncbi:MAG: hypothetical protein ACO1OX_04710 [Novosphingobium sp.]